MQESKEKMLRGRADTLEPRHGGIFEQAERNEVEDLTIQRFVPQLLKRVQLKQSQLRLHQIKIKLE